MTTKSVLTHARLIEVLEYHPDSGWFTRRINPNRANPVGQRAGSTSARGYRTITIDKVSGYKEHQLAWLYVTGEWPDSDIDHANRVRDDNRWNNLRKVTRSQNAQNKDVTGISWDSSRSRYRARIKIDGTSHHIGTFDTADEAHAAYLLAKSSLHPFWSQKM